jgi:DNA-binding NarL/FixJ family response regulator
LLGVQRSDLHDATPTRVLIVEKCPLFRDGVRTCLAKAGGFDICGEAADVAGAEWLLTTSQPDVAIVGVDALEPAVFAFIEELCHRPNGPKVVALLGVEGPPGPTASLFRRGASAVLSKHAPGDELVEAIHNILKGRAYLSAETIEQLIRRRNRTSGSVG